MIRDQPPGSLDAWAAYQRGLWHLSKFGADDYALAEEYFQQAIDLDPNFAGGHTGLAYAQHRAGMSQSRAQGHFAPPGSIRPSGRKRYWHRPIASFRKTIRLDKIDQFLR
jgi:tetratricopeptide (TPR) repeat protein